MSGAYLDAMRDGLAGVLDLLQDIALPLAIFLGLLIAAAIIAYAVKGSAMTIDWPGVRKAAARAFAFMGVGLIVVCLWSGLKQLQPSARNVIEWKESAEASDNPAPEAPPIDQYGPVAATMVEKTYRRSLTLPPEFVQRIGAEGVSVLSPYLVDPTAEDVLKLADSFKRIGQDVAFTREVTREDESPMSFDVSDVKVAFHRLQEQAYDVDFSATYTFTNSTNAPIKARFLFSLPQGGGTVQGLKVEVGGQDITEANNAEPPGGPAPMPAGGPMKPRDSLNVGASTRPSPAPPGPPTEVQPAYGSPAGSMNRPPEPYVPGLYRWTGMMNPGEKRQATVRYKAIGARNWSYDFGSNRRRVKSFSLQATVDGPVQFHKGSIQPSSRSGNTIAWKLSDVVTSQRLALAFPRDVRLREAYLQALATLPATLVLFGLGVLLVGLRLGAPIKPSQLAFGLIVFGLGLGATMVLANYIGPMAAVFLGPLAGAILASVVFGWRSLLAALPIALFPAASLSPQNTGLWVLVLAAVGLAGYTVLSRLGASAGEAAKGSGAA